MHEISSLSNLLVKWFRNLTLEFSAIVNRAEIVQADAKKNNMEAIALGADLTSRPCGLVPTCFCGTAFSLHRPAQLLFYS
jgi:hypothetical protein